MRYGLWFSLFGLLFGWSDASMASETAQTLNLTSHPAGYFALVIFVLAYLLVMTEELTHLRKSKPVLLAAGLIWAVIALVYAEHNLPHLVEEAVRHSLLEYAELMLFLLVAMTYISAMEERKVFDALRCWLLQRGFSFRALFWMTGVLSFCISPVADNLTTALLMCAVVLAMGGNNRKFVSLACINIVVAANAGGAFSPFGDITTLMVWQKGVIAFQDFFVLFVPSLVNFLIPAAIMHFFIPNERPLASADNIVTKPGAKRIVLLFLCTIVTAVIFHSALGLPPVIGMLTGLAYLQFFGYYLSKTLPKSIAKQKAIARANGDAVSLERLGEAAPFDVFSEVASAEWDTLLFFCGVVLCVGGLGYMGYLAMMSEVMYIQLGATQANILVGVLSSVIDNIPVMFAVLTMQPEMSTGQWLLVTMTAGVGGSLLSIGSAAGVALMGQARGQYTFLSHLKWTPVIALGYAASIAVHMWINASLFVS